MLRVFKFKPFEYMLPFSALVKIANNCKDAELLLQLPESVVVKAYKNSFFSRFSSKSPVSLIKLLVLLDKPFAHPTPLSPELLKEIVKAKRYQEEIWPVVKENLSEMRDEEIATIINIYQLNLEVPLKFNDLESFEDLWQVLTWQNKLSISSQTEAFLLKQSHDLVYKDRINLDYICKIYLEISTNYHGLEKLWRFYNSLLKNYLKSLVPSQAIDVCKGFAKANEVFHYEKHVTDYLQSLSEELIREFTGEQLAEVAKILIICKIPIGNAIISRLTDPIPNSADYIYYCILRKLNFNFALSQISEISSNGTLELKVKLLKTLAEFPNFQNQIEVLSKELSKNLEFLSKTDIFDLILVAGTCKGTETLLQPLFQKTEALLPMCTIKDLEIIAQNIGIIVHFDISIPDSLNNSIANAMKGKIHQISSSNFYKFVHLLSYTLPSKLGHTLLTDFLQVKNLPNTSTTVKPSHSNFYTGKNGEFIVLNNQILSGMDDTGIAISLGSIKMKFQVPAEVDEIITDYTKAFLQNKYFKMNQKFRSKVGFQLSIAENFNKDLADMLFTQIEKSYLLNHREIHSYSMQAQIKNFKNLGYFHPIMGKV